MYAVVLFHISFIPDRPTNLSYVPTFKKVGTVGGDPPQRSEFEAAHCRKGRNSRRRPAANRNKSKYRLFPTVPRILAMSQPLKRSEQSAATRREGRNLRRHIAAYLPRSAMRRAISCSFMPTIASPRSSDSSAIILASV